MFFCPKLSFQVCMQLFVKLISGMPNSVDPDQTAPSGAVLGWGGGNLGVVLVQVCEPVFQNLPHSYTWPLKKQTYSYTWSSKMLTYTYTALWFLYPLFAGCYTNITVNSCNTKRISSLKKSLSERYVHVVSGCQKNGAFHIGIQKNRAIHILLVEKRGPVIYLAALKKGAIRHAHPYYAIYRKLPPPPQEQSDLGLHFLHYTILSETLVYEILGHLP